MRNTMTSRTDQEPGTSSVQPAPDAVQPPQRPYAPPLLEVLGDVRELTLGPSGGTGDSINPATRQAV